MYAQIEVPEITKLATLKAGGLATLTYMVFAAHEWRRDGTCFPSLKTIADKLGGAYHIKSIQRALKWLEDNGLIKRQEATSKQRFTMLLRKVKRAVTNTFRKPQNSSQKTQTKRRNNKYYSKRRKINKYHQKEVSRPQKMSSDEAILAELHGAMETRQLHLWAQDPANAPYLTSSNRTPSNYPMPDKRPAKWQNEQVYEVINRRFRAETQEKRSKLYNFWCSLVPVRGFSFSGA